ncbi:MAG: DUF5696 domain-containing protein [Faecalimonas sp.]|nr:DUF5696 domain-containing protein [Faecalimonas sp.]
MKKIGKIKIGLVLMALTAACLAGCGEKGSANDYDKENKIESVSTQTAASNDKFELKWDDAAKCVLLESKETGEVWSDIAYDAYLEGSTSARANSPISITYEEMTGLTWDTAYSYDSSGEVRIASELVEDGICVTYYFDHFEIAIPVTYKLRSDSVTVSVDGAKIQEKAEQYRLVAVNLTPYFASCANSEDNYLFVPSGSGALMYTNETADGTRKYTQEVYGIDAAKKVLTYYADEAAVRLPVFGAKDAGSAMLGIIEEGAGAAYIEGQAGYERLGISNVGATFYFRGSDTFRHPYYATGNSVTTRVSEEHSTQKVSVAYYPLLGEDADYNGMAAKYRAYLLENDLLEKAEEEAPAYAVTLQGGTTEKKSFVGITYDSLTALTKYEQANKILRELSEELQAVPAVRMEGYGDNGLAAGTASGGAGYDGVFGSKKEQKNLQAFCEENNIPLFWDMNLIQYSKSGMGVSKAAKTAILQAAERYPVTALREFDEENPYKLAARESLAKAMEKALKKADKYNHTGVSFASLGELAYGDYNDMKYAVKAGMEDDVTAMLKEAAKDNRLVATAGANWYAACAADYVFDAPTGNGAYDVLDEQIPFYQMVFHAYKPLYTEAVNLAENADRQVMLAAAGGMGLGYTLTAEYNANSAELESNQLYGTVYTDNKALLKAKLVENGYFEYYKQVAASPIVRYELLGDGISATHFENGIVLYANHKNTTGTSPAGELGAYGFAVQGK